MEDVGSHNTEVVYVKVGGGQQAGSRAQGRSHNTTVVYMRWVAVWLELMCWG